VGDILPPDWVGTSVFKPKNDHQKQTKLVKNQLKEKKEFFIYWLLKK